MSYQNNSRILLTPFEGSTLAQARANAINAFMTGDQKFIWEMLYIFYVATAKEDIINECETYRFKVEQELELRNAKRHLTPAAALGPLIDKDNFLRDKNREFFKKIMLLCEANGLTEFGKVKPRLSETPTI